MKISVSMWSLHRYARKDFDVFDFINYISTLNVQGVELLDIFWDDFEIQFPKVKKLLKEKNLKVAAYAVSNNFALPDPEARKKQIEHVKEGIDIAAKFDTKVLRVFSGHIEEDDEITFEEARNWIVEGLRECAEYADEKGIILGLENHGKFVGKCNQIRGLIKDVGLNNLRVTFDVGNFLLVDEVPDENLNSLMDLTTHVHFKDFCKGKEGVVVHTTEEGHKYIGTVPGEGKVNLEKILKTLSMNGYSDWLSVEYEGQRDEKVGTELAVNNLETILSKL